MPGSPFFKANPASSPANPAPNHGEPCLQSRRTLPPVTANPTPSLSHGRRTKRKRKNSIIGWGEEEVGGGGGRQRTKRTRKNSELYQDGMRIPRLSEPNTSLHTTPPSARVLTLRKASLFCKHGSFLSCEHVCIYTFVTPLIVACLEKCNLCQRCGRSSHPG